ncbi:MAG: hypothetical protein ACOCXX_00005, partial [Planctomycetota bacterium]
MKKLILLLVLLVGVASVARAADYYINNKTGDDKFTGGAAEVADGGVGPVRTFKKALSLLKPGDTLHVADTGTVYRQSVNLRHGGKPGQPITIDGHGAWLTGADKLDPAGWKPYRDGVLVRDDQPVKQPTYGVVVDDVMLNQVRDMDVIAPGQVSVLVSRGKVALYGNPPQGKSLGKVKVEVTYEDGTTETLEPKTWHHSHSRIKTVRRYRYIKGRPVKVTMDGQDAAIVTAPQNLAPGEWTRRGTSLYYRPPEGKTVDQVNFYAINRSSGVALSGRFAHVVVKNFNTVWFSNDGYNIHGGVTDATFINCNAFHTFDEGFSSHDRCETVLDGAILVDSSHSIANVNTHGHSVTRNVVFARARLAGILLPQNPQAWHTVENAILIDNPSQVAIRPRKPDSAGKLTLKNLLVIGTEGGRAGTGLNPGQGTVSDVTIAGCGRAMWAGPHDKATLTNLLIGPGQGTLHVRQDDPAAALSMKNVLVGTGIKLEYGARYPWKTLPVAEWF